MNTKDIRLHLIHRYLHGYTVMDKKYEEIIKYLLIQVKDNLQNNKIERLLCNIIGNYNAITANIYLEIAIRYLTYKRRKHNTLDDLYKII